MDHPPAKPCNPQAQLASRWFLPAAGLAALLIAALTFCFDTSAYMRIMTVLMIVPFPRPFIDAQAVPAVVECARQGIDVFVSVPCDPGHRLWDYSPIWLWATFLPPWANWMGICMDAAFFMSLALLPRPSGRTGLMMTALATFSSAPVFALERGNVDLIMFVLIALGGFLWARSFGLRLAGYALFGLAGFLKFYPLVLFLLFIRERVFRFAALICIGFATLAAFILRYHADLRQAAANMPVFSEFTDAFGSHQLPRGLEAVIPYFLRSAGLSWPFLTTIRAQALFAWDAWATLTIAAIAFGLWLAAQTKMISAFSEMDHGARCFLVIGSALMCFNFFACENDSYREIFLLFTIPGMLRLAAVPGVGRTFGFTAAAIVFVMWGLTSQVAVARLSGGLAYPMGGSVPILTYWFVRELVWWWIISILLCILFGFIAQSPVWRGVQELRQRRPARRSPRSLRRAEPPS